MSNLWLVTSAGMKNAFRLKTSMMILIGVTLICVVGIALLMCILLIVPEMKSAMPDRAALEAHLGIILYLSSFISIGVGLNSLVFQMMVREQSRGNLAALMATPLKLFDIWLGKSLALFIPGLIIAIVLTVLNLVIINLIYFIPEVGFLCNWQMLVNSLVILPLMYFFFGMLVHLVGFTTKPVTGNIIAQVFLPVMINVIIQLVVRNVIDINSWQFMALNLGLAVIFGAIILSMKARLTPEKVILAAG